MKPKEILFLTILRLRKYNNFFDLGQYFNIGKSTAEYLYKKGIISISTRSISFNPKYELYYKSIIDNITK